MAYKGIHVIPELSVFDNHVDNAANNMVFEDGDNWVWATSGQPAEVIDEVFVGSVVMNRVYVGSDLVHERDQLQTVTLTSAEDLNLSTWLGTQGVNAAVPVIINFASDQIIGGTINDKPALDLGDLSAYTGGITFNIDGQIQAKAGYDAVWAQDPIDIINAGTISGAIQEGVGTAGAIITLVISSTGKILAGGGDGGAGGKGGNGDDAINKEGPYLLPAPDAPQPNLTYVWWYGTTPLTVWPSKWNGATVFTNDTTGGGSTIRFRLVSGKWYWPSDPTYNARYAIGRGSAVYGSGGAGGVGGIGAGYTQARTDGVNGAGGTYRSGTGGKGGDGGDWGIPGGDGAHGGGGLYYNNYSNSNVRAGVAGSPGTLAGNAFMSTATMRILGVNITMALGL